MDAVLRAAYQFDDAVKATGRIISILRRESWEEAEVGYAKCDCLKNWRKGLIKRAIDENGSIKRARDHPFGG